MVEKDKYKMFPGSQPDDHRGRLSPWAAAMSTVLSVHTCLSVFLFFLLFNYFSLHTSFLSLCQFIFYSPIFFFPPSFSSLPSLSVRAVSRLEMLDICLDILISKYMQSCTESGAKTKRWLIMLCSVSKGSNVQFQTNISTLITHYTFVYLLFVAEIQNDKVLEKLLKHFFSKLRKLFQSMQTGWPWHLVRHPSLPSWICNHESYSNGPELSMSMMYLCCLDSLSFHSASYTCRFTSIIVYHWCWLHRLSSTPCTSTSRGSTSSRRRTTPPRCSTSSLRSSAPLSSSRPSSLPSLLIRTSWWVGDGWCWPTGIKGHVFLLHPLWINCQTLLFQEVLKQQNSLKLHFSGCPGASDCIIFIGKWSLPSWHE